MGWTQFYQMGRFDNYINNNSKHKSKDSLWFNIKKEIDEIISSSSDLKSFENIFGDIIYWIMKILKHLNLQTEDWR